MKNRIRAILETEALALPSGTYGFFGDGLNQLRQWAKPMSEVNDDELWRGMLDEELTQLEQVQQRLSTTEAKLEALGQSDSRVQQLRQIPGVGPRLSEAVVAVIDEPRRFRRSRQVASYVGLTPRQFQSGAMDRKGRITGAGHKTLRALLMKRRGAPFGTTRQPEQCMSRCVAVARRERNWPLLPLRGDC